MFQCLLEMLVVFAGVPIAAPGKAVSLEKLITQIVFINLVRKILAPVCIGFAARRGNVVASVRISAKDNIRIVERIDVDRQAIGMLGKTVSTVYNAVVKARGIIVCHGECIISIVFVNQADSLKLIFI